MLEYSSFSVTAFPTLFSFLSPFYFRFRSFLWAFYPFPGTQKRLEHKHKQTQPAVDGFLAFWPGAAKIFGIIVGNASCGMRIAWLARGLGRGLGAVWRL